MEVGSVRRRGGSDPPHAVCACVRARTLRVLDSTPRNAPRRQRRIPHIEVPPMRTKIIEAIGGYLLVLAIVWLLLAISDDPGIVWNSLW